MSGAVCPTVNAALDGCTVTLATGLGRTLTEAVPVLPSLVAVIVAVPTPTPLTNPVLETFATVGSLELHVIGRSFAGDPFTSVSVAES